MHIRSTNERYQCGEIHVIQAHADESTEVCRKSRRSNNLQLERINHNVCVLTVNETGPSRVEALWLWGPERASLVLSLDKHSAERYLWGSGINTELLTELLFLVEMPFWEFRRMLNCSPVHQTIINTLLLSFDMTGWPLTICLVNDPWIMASFVHLTT